MEKISNNGFTEIYFITSKKSDINGKVTHFKHCIKASVCFYNGGDSVTLIGGVEIIEDIFEKRRFDGNCNKKYFKKGFEDPKCYLLRFRANEATFWIEGKYRTCKYKVN